MESMENNAHDMEKRARGITHLPGDPFSIVRNHGEELFLNLLFVESWVGESYPLNPKLAWADPISKHGFRGSGLPQLPGVVGVSSTPQALA